MFSGGFRGAEEESSTSQPQNIDNKSLYELLEVQPYATTVEIKKAYKRKAMREYPNAKFNNKFEKVTEAYQILSNPETKDLYDRFGMKGVKGEEDMSEKWSHFFGGGVKNGGGKGDMSEIISHFFGGGGKDSRQKNMKTKLRELEVTLEDVYEGKTIHLKHQRKRVCEGCEGKGGANSKQCPTCKGKGVVEKLAMLGPGMYTQSSEPCSDCRSQGTIFTEKDRCKKCQGNKVIDVEKVVEIPLEKGVPEEHDYQFNGESDEYPGVMAEDLYIRIRIKKHPMYERRGADLYTTKRITSLEALTGCQFTLKFLDGTYLNVSTKPGEVISPNSFRTIKHKGMPFYKDAIQEGDLHIQFEIEMPAEIQQEQINEHKNILPKPQESIVKFDLNQQIFLNEYDANNLNSNPEGGKRKDDEEDSQSRGQMVQCAQQ